MKYTIKIQKAIKFASKTHHVYQDQKRKGKSIPYITHPLAVALILSLVDADEDVIVAGILHDTIEDSAKEKKVTREMIRERFGEKVAKLVEDVTENKKIYSWKKRKKEAIDHIKNFSKNSLLLKSADIISNNSELIDDYLRFGDEVFDRFHGSKKMVINHYLEAINAITLNWKRNPLNRDLLVIKKELERIKNEH